MTPRHKSALVVVDMQNDFLAQGGYYDEISRLTAQRGGNLSQADIGRLGQLYRHPPTSCVIRDGYQELVARASEVATAALARQMPTIFIRTTYNPASCYRPPLFIAAPQRQDYACRPGSWGAELIEPIKRCAEDRCARIVEKHTFDAFFETGLRALLRFHQVETLYVAGIETNICVLCTALSALTNGFATVILEDCVATSLVELHAPALRIIEVAKGQRMSRHAFLAMIHDQAGNDRPGERG